MKARSPGEQPLRRMLVKLPLLELPLDEERVAAGDDDRRIAVREELRVEEVVGPDLVPGVAARLLRPHVRLRRLGGVARTEKGSPVVELDDRIAGVLLS